VIEGIGRYQKDADNKPSEQAKPGTLPDIAIPLEKGNRRLLDTFLNKIRNIFEEDVQ